MTATTTADLRDKVRQMVEENPGEMTPVMAAKLGVTELELFRLLPSDKCTELVAGPRAIELVKRLESLGKVHVIASNEGCVLEAYGHFGKFSVTGPFLNVQTADLDMHIRHPMLEAAFALLKPSHQDGQPTYSIQFFGPSGKSVFKVFLYKSVTEKDGGDVAETIAEWERIRSEFARPAEA